MTCGGSCYNGPPMDDRAGDTIQQLILRNLSDPAAPIAFVQNGVTIGSDANCTVVLRQPGVRAIHARIVRDRNQRWRLQAETGRPIMLAEGGSAWDVTRTGATLVTIGETAFGCDDSLVTTPDLG